LFPACFQRVHGLFTACFLTVKNVVTVVTTIPNRPTAAV
jgi:hypothetical protein